MKKYIFGAAALTLAIGLSSFTAKKAVDTWFSYQLSSNTGFNNPANYDFEGATEPSNPLGGTVINAIKVDAQTEMYPSNYSVVEHRSKPKVDITGTGTLNEELQQAISLSQETMDRVTLK